MDDSEWTEAAGAEDAGGPIHQNCEVTYNSPSLPASCEEYLWLLIRLLRSVEVVVDKRCG